jgi:hypothetical protein
MGDRLDPLYVANNDVRAKLPKTKESFNLVLPHFTL